jgi:long-chain acyl-CoA synthetase
MPSAGGRLLSANIAQVLDGNLRQFGEYKQLIYLSNGTEQSFTNKQILDRARALATGLKNMGLNKGDVVASVLSNIPEIPEVMNGVMRTGAVYMPVIFMLTPPEIRYILEDANCKMIITEEKLLPKVLEASIGISSVRAIILIGETPVIGTTPYKDATDVSDERGDVAEVTRDDLAIIAYAAGTTGYPKGVILTHENMASQLRSGATVWGFDKGQALLTTVPMNTIYGIVSCLEGYLTGFVNILMPPFDPRKVLDAIKRCRVSVLPVVPTMLNFMLMVWNPAADSMSSVNMLVSAAAPLPLDTLERAKKTFGVEVLQTYGLTEASGSVTRQRRDWPVKPGSVGFPVPGISVKIVDDNGFEVPRGQEGEIVCKGPMVMKGYLNKLKETADVLKDGWLYTGDMGKFDDDGELYITGRKKDIIIKGGENIDPGLSENWLGQHPDVLECSVFGVQDDKYGEEIAAAVVLRPGTEASEEELLTYLASHIHHYMMPQKIFFMKYLPKTGLGNVQKRELKRMLDDH